MFLPAGSTRKWRANACRISTSGVTCGLSARISWLGFGLAMRRPKREAAIRPIVLLRRAVCLSVRLELANGSQRRPAVLNEAVDPQARTSEAPMG